jgi:hypothetical protein
MAALEAAEKSRFRQSFLGGARFTACGKMQFVNCFERVRLQAAPLSSTKSVRL